MENSQTFPLLRLPILPIENILSTMAQTEILNFALSSKQCRFFTKSLSRKRTHSGLSLSITEQLDIQLQESVNDPIFQYCMTTSQTEKGKVDHYLSSDRSWYVTFVYCKDLWTGFQKRSEIMIDVFGLKFSNLFFDFDHFLWRNSIPNGKVIDWLKSLTGGTFNCNTVTLLGTNVVTDQVHNFLNHLKVSKALIVGLTLNENRAIDIPNDLIKLEVHHARWVNLEKLLEMKIPTITLLNSSLTNQDMNLFLQKRMASETHQNLKYLMVEIQDEISLDVVIGNFPHRVYYPKYSFLGKYPVSQVRDIESNDGKHAFVFTINVEGSTRLVIATENRILLQFPS